MAAQKGKKMKNLRKATADLERAKIAAKIAKAKAEAAAKKVKECEADKEEAENMEYARIVREMHLTIPELLELKKKLTKELPGKAALQEGLHGKEEITMD